MTDQTAQITAPTRLEKPAPPRKTVRRIGPVLLFCFTAVLAVLTVTPLVWMVSASLKPGDETFSPDIIPLHPTLDNFRYVFTAVPFWRYMFNSFFVAGTITVVALWFHSMAGFALARLRFPGREAIFLAIFSTFLVSLPVIIVPLFILVRQMGMVNSYAGLIIPAIFNAFGIFLLRQFYIAIPQELQEAAVIDGASYFRIYWNIMLPLSRPILAALAVFFFLANWNAFIWPLTITNDPNLWVVQIAIASFQQQYSASWNYIMAGSTIVALPTLLLFFIFQRQLVESIKTSGLK
jgi:multiple sugar transport system permease protein